MAFAHVSRAVHESPERRAFLPPRVHGKGVVDGLHEQIVSPGDQRGDDVDDLGDVRDTDRVGVAHEAVQETGHDEGVFEVVHLLHQVRREFALSVRFAVLVPDIPFVEAQVRALVAPAPGLDEPANRVHLLDLPVDGVRDRQVVRRIVLRVAHVTVQADVVGVIAQVVEDLPVPFHVGVEHVHGAGTAGDQLDPPVRVLHHLRGLLGPDRVLVRRHVAELPVAVHLVAQAPQADVVGHLLPVAHPYVGEVRARGTVAILDPVPGFLGRARAEVDREHGIPVHLAAQPDELVGTESVRLDALPGEFAHSGTQLLRAHAVHPVVAGGEVAAGVPHDGHGLTFHRIHDVRAEPVLVRVLAVRVVHALVDRPADMLQEASEDPRIDRRDLEFRVRV